MNTVLPNERLCSGLGRKHTDKFGKKLLSVTLAEIIAMIEKPQSLAKEVAQWVIPSTLHTRALESQKKDGAYHAAWLDIDKGSPALEEVRGFLAKLGVFFAVYSTKSATPSLLKWRGIIPFAYPATATEFSLIAEVLNDRLKAAGIEPDRHSEAPQQVLFLPNEGEFYQWHIADELPLFDWKNALGGEIEAKQTEAKERKAKQAAQRELSRLRAAERMATGCKFPKDAYNAEYSIEQNLIQYGFKQRGKKWVSPHSESGVAQLEIKGDKWKSHHGSDCEMGMGKLNPDGNSCWGDAFDLFQFFEHSDNEDAAIKAAGDMFTTSDGRTITNANQINFMEQGAAAMAAMAEGFDVPAFMAKMASGEYGASSNDGGEGANEKPTFKRVSLADVFTNPPTEQDYIWAGRIPLAEPTLLAAHGGTGKSLFAIQLGCHTSVGADFLNLPTAQIKTLFFSAEDATATIRRRVAGICQDDGLDPAQVAENLIVLDATDAPTLFQEVSDKGVKTGVITEYYNQLKQIIDDEEIGFLIIDNASDTFGANPIDRQAVTKFIRSLTRLVRERGGAVLLLSHVNKVTSKAGSKQNDTEGYADSAAWHNAARSRLFLNATDEDGGLALTHQKNNFGKKQPVLNMRFRTNGTSLESIECGSGAGATKEFNDNLKKNALLKLINEFYQRGEWVNPAPQSNSGNAFALFKAEAAFPFSKNRDGKAECFNVLRECERDGLLCKESYKKLDRHPGERWQLTPKGINRVGKLIDDEVLAKLGGGDE